MGDGAAEEVALSDGAGTADELGVVLLPESEPAAPASAQSVLYVPRGAAA